MAELLAGAAAAGGTGLAASSPIAAGLALTGGATSLVPGVAAAGLGSTVLSILQGLATAASVVGTLQSAASDRDQALANATQSDLEAGQSRVQTEQQTATLKRELVKVLGENDVAIAAAGIDLEGGIAQTSRAAAQKQAADQISISRRDDEMRRALLKARANGYRAQARSAETGGLLRALGEGADFGIGLLQRG